MFQDGSFTCTLFLPSGPISDLESSTDSSAIPDFFDSYFHGVTSLISSEQLTASFKNNPHLPLISIKCAPYHYTSSALIIGDAAHAMVPFYGQGMNAGLEDVRVFFSIWDNTSEASSSDITGIRAEALAAYSRQREPDAHAINDLALQNYIEMRSSVVSRSYQWRKWLEEKLSVWVPSLGWATKYSGVSFGNERYSEIVRKSDRQGRLLVMGMIGLVSSPFVAGLLTWGVLKWRGRGRGAGEGVLGFVEGLWR